jgi:hypothetical protein
MGHGVHFVPQLGKAFQNPTSEPKRILYNSEFHLLNSKHSKEDLNYINIFSASSMKLVVITTT